MQLPYSPWSAPMSLQSQQASNRGISDRRRRCNARWMQTARPTLIWRRAVLSLRQPLKRENTDGLRNGAPARKRSKLKLYSYRCSAPFKHENVISDRTGLLRGRDWESNARARWQIDVVLFPFRSREHRRELSVKREEVRLETGGVKKGGGGRAGGERERDRKEDKEGEGKNRIARIGWAVPELD